MNIFSDYHHVSLYKSFVLLFEKRYGGNVFRPIGMEWYEKGFWNIFDAEDTRQQYLSLDQTYKPVDGTPALNQIANTEENCYLIQDTESPSEFLKAITFEQFQRLPIDYIIASIPQHVEPFKRLIAEYKPTAKLIVQVGNSWTFDEMKGDNILASAVMYNVHGDVNFITYHQEFDTTIFRPENWIVFNMEHPEIRTPEKNIYSFINILQETPDFPIFQQLEQRLPDWKFRSYGGQCRDGCITGSANLSHEIRKARFVYHLKPGGDGYGHVLHNAVACGRPVIFKRSSYENKIGQRILIDGVSGIDVDGLSLDGIIEKLTHYNEENRYRDLCKSTYKLFKEQVNFEQEAQEIRGFLERAK